MSDPIEKPQGDPIPRPLYGWIPAMGAMKLHVDPPIPDGYIPQVPPGVVKIAQWTRSEIEIKNIARSGVPYVIGFIKGTTAEGIMLGLMAIKKLRGGK